jgi:hypothetical protein
VLRRHTPRRRGNEQALHQSAKKILKAMSQSETWRKQEVTDPKWLDSTNKFIRGYNEGLDNVKDLLLYLAPKLSNDNPVLIKIEEQD